MTVGAALQLLHVTREAFLFISACMIAYSFRDVLHFELRPFWRRRFTSVGVPYLCWTLIYFFITLHGTTGSVASRLDHLAYLVGTGYYQLYFLVVLLEFYAVFPLLLILLRRTVGHHGLLLAVSGALQVLIVSLMHWGVLPHWMRGFWATREVTSYQFYLIAGMVVAFHLDEVHRWLCAHVRLVLGLTLASAALAEGWYYLAVYHVVSWLGSSSDPFQPMVIPWNIGAIASIYLLGVWLVGRQSLRPDAGPDQNGVGRLLRHLSVPAGLHHGVGLVRLAAPQCVHALADPQPDHGGDRVHRLRRPDRAAGPDGTGEGPHRTLADRRRRRPTSGQGDGGLRRARDLHGPSTPPPAPPGRDSANRAIWLR